MNYKVLAASAVISAGVIAFGLYEAQTPQRRVTERVAAPQPRASQWRRATWRWKPLPPPKRSAASRR